MATSHTLEFVEGGRTYCCQVEPLSRSRAEAWWWFSVKDDGSRYAPFRAEDDDTDDSVRARVVAYYEERLARRAMPWHPRGRPAAASTPAPQPEPSTPGA
jgi:hypothetical protein